MRKNCFLCPLGFADLYVNGQESFGPFVMKSVSVFLLSNAKDNL